MRRFLDVATHVSAGVSVISFWQGVEIATTITAGVISIILGCISLYDRYWRKK